MTASRLNRRLAILKGKREGAFNPDQYYVEGATRAKAARKARCALRLIQPLALVTPPWSGARTFLEDARDDLTIGSPHMHAAVLSLHPLHRRPSLEVWPWLLGTTSRLLGVAPPTGAYPTGRTGFRRALRRLFQSADRGERKALLLYDVQALEPATARDILSVMEDLSHDRVGGARFTVLVAAPEESLPFSSVFTRLGLPDFKPREAVTALVERVGAEHHAVLKALVARVGGIPALLEALARCAPTQYPTLCERRAALWTALGAAGQEIRLAVERSLLVPDLAARLEALASQGTVAYDPESDGQLVDRGLIRVVTNPDGSSSSSLRAPALADLISAVR